MQRTSLTNLNYWGMQPVARVSIKYQNTSVQTDNIRNTDIATATPQIEQRALH
jgi:hypothetical protein